MRNSLRTAIFALLCGATTASAIPSEALAGPMSVAPPSAVSLAAPMVDVHYRRCYPQRWGYHRPHYHWGYRRVVYYRPYYRWGYYRPYYRRWAYGYPYDGYYGFNPGAAVFGSALGLMGAGLTAATAPAWGWGWGWGWGPGWVGWW